MFRTLTLATLIALPLAAGAAADPSLQPVYLEASQYTAQLQPALQTWRIAPLDGNDVEIRASGLCPHSTVPAHGLWLLGRDADGRPELVAPSATLLARDQPDHIALRSCDDPALRDGTTPAYGVPSPVLDVLLAQTGAVLVDD